VYERAELGLISFFMEMVHSKENEVPIYCPKMYKEIE